MPVSKKGHTKKNNSFGLRKKKAYEKAWQKRQEELKGSRWDYDFANVENAFTDLLDIKKTVKRAIKEMK